MRNFISILFLAATICVKAQENKVFPVIKNADKFNWAKIEKKVPHTTIVKFVNEHSGSFYTYLHPEQYNTTIEELYASLHFIDLNNDRLDDVIYKGRSTGEGDMVEIFLNTGKEGYKQVFEDRQGIVRMDFENNQLYKLYVTNWGCCDDYQIIKKIYTVSFSKTTEPVFKQVYQSFSILEASEPDSLFDKPFRFMILNDNYNLRSDPGVDDSTREHWDTDSASQASGRGHGNLIAVLPENTQGTAVGWKKDDTGRVWWYVEIDAQYKLRKNAFYQNENTFPTKAVGWISSRFVKKL
jgi:hypothetical protein